MVFWASYKFCLTLKIPFDGLKSFLRFFKTPFKLWGSSGNPLEFIFFIHFSIPSLNLGALPCSSKAFGDLCSTLKLFVGSRSLWQLLGSEFFLCFALIIGPFLRLLRLLIEFKVFWRFFGTLHHRTALLIFWPLKPAVSSDRSIPAWQSHKM